MHWILVVQHFPQRILPIHDWSTLQVWKMVCYAESPCWSSANHHVWHLYILYTWAMASRGLQFFSRGCIIYHFCRKLCAYIHKNLSVKVHNGTQLQDWNFWTLPSSYVAGWAHLNIFKGWKKRTWKYQSSVNLPWTCHPCSWLADDKWLPAFWLCFILLSSLVLWGGVGWGGIITSCLSAFHTYLPHGRHCLLGGVGWGGVGY